MNNLEVNTKDNLNLVKDEIIPVYRTTDGGEKVVDAKELYEYLNVSTYFTTWFDRRVEEYEFEEGLDFFSFLKESNGGRPSKEYVLTLDMGKELGMLEKSEEGRRIRKYFIEFEKRGRELIEQEKERNSLSQDNALELVKILEKDMEELEIDAHSKLATKKSILEASGVDIPLQIPAPTEDKFISMKEIAGKIGIYTNSGNPHSTAVGAILEEIGIDEDLKTTTTGSNGSHTYSQTQYSESVIPDIEAWLNERGYPTRIDFEDRARGCNVKY